MSNSVDSPKMEHARTMFLDLFKRSLVNWYYGHTAMREMRLYSLKRKLIARLLDRFGYTAMERKPIPMDQLTDGRGTYCDASYTLVGLKRLNNVEKCVRTVLEESVPGDLLEAGVWAGGTCIFMKAILELYKDHERTVWVADSFEGLPPPNPELYPQDANDYLHQVDELAISLETVQENFKRFDLLDDRVCFIKGFFKDTLHEAPIDRLAVLRMDGDMYESTMDTLDALYPKLSVGGFLIIDDYARANCAAAVADYRERNGITEAMITIDWTGAYWRKERI